MIFSLSTRLPRELPKIHPTTGLTGAYLPDSLVNKHLFYPIVYFRKLVGHVEANLEKAVQLPANFRTSCLTCTISLLFFVVMLLVEYGISLYQFMSMYLITVY